MRSHRYIEDDNDDESLVVMVHVGNNGDELETFERDIDNDQGVVVELQSMEDKLKLLSQ